LFVQTFSLPVKVGRTQSRREAVLRKLFGVRDASQLLSVMNVRFIENTLSLAREALLRDGSPSIHG
jgi:hypothetical protein